MNPAGKHSKIAIALILLTTLAALSLYLWRSNTDDFVKIPEEIEEFLFWEARPLKEFHLTSADNDDFSLEQLKGKWSFIFFGYTHCPDVCPTTLMQLGSLFKIMEQNPAIYPDMQGIFISVDPQRDTPALLKKYVTYFHPGFIGLTGSKQQIDDFSRQIGVLYNFHSKTADDIYEVTHNSTIFLIDPEGRLYGRFGPPQMAQQIAGAFIRIHAFYKKQHADSWSLF